MACRAVAWPVSRCDRPMVLSMPSVRETLGRRMSASISSTREPPYASAIAMLQAVVVLPSSGCALVSAMTRVPFGAAAEHERRAERAERLAEFVRHFLRQQRVIVALDRRHEPEERQLEPPRDVFGRLDGVVEVVDRQDEAEREQQPGQRAQQEIPADVGRERRAGHDRAIHQPHVVAAAVADNLQLVLPLQQRLVNLRDCSAPRARAPCS